MHILLSVVIAAILLVKLQLLAVLNINWDEFRFLARVYELRADGLHTAFQTFYTRLYAWIPLVSGHEVEQVLAGRRVAFALQLVTSACVFALGRRLFGTTGALFAVVASLGFSHVMRHGESFRADPIIVCLALIAATLPVLALRRGAVAAVAGSATALALAALVSVKAVVYLPAVVVAVAAAPRGTIRQGTLWRLTLFGSTALGVYFGLLGMHAAALPDASLASAGATASAVIKRVFLIAPLPGSLGESLRQDWVFWILLLLGGALAVTELLWGANDRRRTGAVILAFLLPATTLLYYRNAFAYYFVAIVPPASLAVGLSAARIDAWLSGRPLAGVLVLALLTAQPLATAIAARNRLGAHDTVARQRIVLGAVRQVFPQPVPYIDRCSMVSAYPSAAPFLTTYMLHGYREAGIPRMSEFVQTRRPRFVLANVDALDLSVRWEDTKPSPYRLLREDFEFLQARYVHHWGPIWVAGASLQVGPGETGRLHLPVPGHYTVEAEGVIQLDGRTVRGGDTLELADGPHEVGADARRQTVTLRLGVHLPRPTGLPPSEPLFLGLGFPVGGGTGAVR